MLNIIKWTIFTLAALFVLAQFVRPERLNPPGDQSLALEANSRMTPEVAALLGRACGDCHSNRTEWPWYSHVAPVSWLVVDHVNHGRRHLNFSTWAEYGPSERVALLSDIEKTVRHGSMPMDSYTLLHPEARLSDRERGAITGWASEERDRLLADGRKSEAGPSNN